MYNREKPLLCVENKIRKGCAISMVIPDYQRIMLPLLEYISDQKEHAMRDLSNALAEKFQLSEEERKELLPSGQQSLFYNRVGWARTYLKKAGLLESTRRGYVKITKRGLETLDQNPQAINIKHLTQFPEFLEFQRGKKSPRPDPDPDDTEDKSGSTPEETLESAYEDIRKTLAQEIIDNIMICSPYFFEKLVIDLLLKMGYGGSRLDAGKAMGRSGDEGIDGVIKEDRLGLDVIYIQAKKWTAVVGRPELQKFVGALYGQKAKKGVFITTSSFSKEAMEFVTKIENKVILIDGEQLAEMMIDHDVGVSIVNTYQIKKIDYDFFLDD